MIKHDLKRVWGTNYIFSVLLSWAIMLLIMVEQKGQGMGVFSIMESILYSCEYMIVLAMAMMPYTYAIAEDFERKTIYQVLTRTNLKRYILSLFYLHICNRSSVYIVCFICCKSAYVWRIVVIV